MDFLDVVPLGHLRVVAQQLAGSAVLAEGNVVLLQFGVGYGYHEPLKGISKGFCRSCGVVGHGAKLTLFMPKIGNLYRFGCRLIKKNKKKLTQEVAKRKTVVSLTYKPTTKPKNHEQPTQQIRAKD
ncbi:MAG: hypothetical protein EBS36_07490 [Actinobacteria bacterium]|nr:hypothetical protein [Actinomycetota bacterium]